jgi:hypothetical protein
VQSDQYVTNIAATQEKDICLNIRRQIANERGYRCAPDRIEERDNIETDWTKRCSNIGESWQLVGLFGRVCYPKMLSGLVLPQLVQHGLHFPFPLVEAKGFATSSNMMSTENQAAVGEACAIDILKALQHPVSRLPISSSVSPLKVFFTNFSFIIILIVSFI